MAAAALNRLLSTLFLATVVLNFPIATFSDEPCQYPCYPPPMGTVTPTTPSTQLPPPSAQTGSYSPPVTGGGVFPTPYPYNPPPYYGGGSFGAQPPPDPILPYFPFYYKQPLHRSPDDDSSSATLALGRSTNNLIMISILLFCFYVNIIYRFP
ncbi:extensin [Humulus lupulus]|uniref:extensin n=1 Tax=Humulus lupulus TaxID=3486 RepID=UPI002B406DAC|nr:extensin [Humulus lupulus]